MATTSGTNPSLPRGQGLPRVQSRQGIYWMATIPHHCFTPFLPQLCAFAKGQLELSESGYLHWQLLFVLERKASLATMRSTLGPYHFELTRSSASDSYVWKDETAIPSTRFELGTKPFRRQSANDWDAIKLAAKSGQLDSSVIPSDVFIRCYSSLSRIAKDYCRPLPMERVCQVYWGRTGTGKSRRAWEEATIEAYCKDPNTKFWDGYRDQNCVVIDEFRGTISISHLLRWLDRYPVIVEVKGGAMPLSASMFWITSNVDPREWYGDIDESTKDALLRRLNITHFL